MMRCTRAAFLASVIGIAVLAAAAQADVLLPRIFGHNMVLQREMAVPVWGWAAPGEKVVVTFGGQQKSAVADATGKWMVRLDPMPANKTEQEMTVEGANKVTFTGVLVGEVWLCSGQSNMEMGVGPSLNFTVEKEAAKQPLIRHIKFPHVSSTTPQENVAAIWVVCDPNTVASFTAAGYFFARELVKELDVPVGLIGSNWGGTPIEPWTPPEGFRMVEELKNMSRDVDSWDPQSEAWQKNHAAFIAKVKEWVPKAEAALAARRPLDTLPAGPIPVGDTVATHIYNGIVCPIVPFAIRGALWYQGEANGGEGVTYLYKMRALVGGWRKVWGEGDFPFYYVQLANWQHSDPRRPEGGDGWARVREAQTQALEIPNTGMACIIDIGEADDIHPRDKQDVGKRLALWALAKTYGKKDLVFSGPIFKAQTVEGNKIRVRFDYVGGGLMLGHKDKLDPVQPSAGGKLAWAAIAGADKVWYPADAVIDGETVVFSSEKVANPVAVRYAFAMNPEGANLYNKEGLPAVPFRTDKW